MSETAIKSITGKLGKVGLFGLYLLAFGVVGTVIFNSMVSEIKASMTEVDPNDKRAYAFMPPDFEPISPIACDGEYCARYMRDNGTGLCFVSRSVDSPSIGAHGRNSFGPFDCELIKKTSDQASSINQQDRMLEVHTSFVL